MLDNVEGDMTGDLPRNADELMEYLQPTTPVRVPVLASLYEELVKTYPSLKEYLVVTEFNALTMHISNFIISHLTPLSEYCLDCHEVTQGAVDIMW